MAGDTTVHGGQLSPGSAAVNSIGTLFFRRQSHARARTLTLMELNAAAQTNDLLNVAGTLTCGGTLYVANLAGNTCVRPELPALQRRQLVGKLCHA